MWLMKATIMQGQSISPGCRDINGLARRGCDVVVILFQGLRTWWRREFMVLLEYYRVLCPLLSSLQDCFGFSKTGGRSMSQTHGSHSSLRQSHLKSETGQRREKMSKLDLFIWFYPAIKMAAEWLIWSDLWFKRSVGFFLLDFSAPVTLR